MKVGPFRNLVAPENVNLRRKEKVDGKKEDKKKTEDKGRFVISWGPGCTPLTNDKKPGKKKTEGCKTRFSQERTHGIRTIKLEGDNFVISSGAMKTFTIPKNKVRFETHPEIIHSETVFDPGRYTKDEKPFGDVIIAAGKKQLLMWFFEDNNLPFSDADIRLFKRLKPTPIAVLLKQELLSAVWQEKARAQNARKKITRIRLYLQKHCNCPRVYHDQYASGRVVFLCRRCAKLHRFDIKAEGAINAFKKGRRVIKTNSNFKFDQIATRVENAHGVALPRSRGNVGDY